MLFQRILEKNKGKSKKAYESYMANRNQFHLLQMPYCDLSPGSSAVLFFFISGVVGTLAYKLMGSQSVNQGGHEKAFYHPYMQAMTMSIGELICLFIYYSNLEKYKAPLEEGKTPHKFYYFLVPGFWDITLSVMQYFALSFISGSTFKLLQGGSIITTLIFSKIMLGMIIQKRHVIGCSLAVIGLITIGLSSLINSNSNGGSSFGLQVLGCAMMLTSLIFEGYKYAYEQRLMQRHTIHQYELVGWEGFFGLIIIIILSLMFSIIPCGFTEELCVYDSHGNPYLQRFDEFFIQTCTSWPLAILVIVGTLSCTVSNASGMAITKYFDGLTRCLMSMSKTALVWIIGMIVTFSVGEDPNYQLQSKSLPVNLVKALGFVFIIVGTLIYNKLIFVSCFSKEEEDAVDPQEEKDLKGQLLSSGRE